LKRAYNRPYTVKQKESALNLLEKIDVIKVAHKYGCTERTIYRWRASYDGTLSSLENKSSKPLTSHPNQMTEHELANIHLVMANNPTARLNELYGILMMDYEFKRNPVTLYRYFRKINFYGKKKKKDKSYKPQKYDTPTNMGEKMQMDVKYVPTSCKNKNLPIHKRFYQYTIIDEATRERFLWTYGELTAKNTVDFVKKAINYYGYTPKIIQTDNGNEFTYTAKTEKIHPLTQYLNDLEIIHKRIRPYTPRHNGKVERSHRNDNERFYEFLTFGSLKEINEKMQAYLIRSNNIPTVSLKWKSPLQKRTELLKLSQF